MRSRTIAIATALAALTLVPVAAAHVTLNPRDAAAGSFTELSVRVPNERDDANTIKVDVKFPAGFGFASYEPVPGWTVAVKRKKLAQPIQTDDGEVTEEVSEMIWTGDGKTGKIAPGQFMDFPISVQIPGKAGDTLTFPTLQTYDNGEIVRWIGPPDASEPAPQVTVTGTADGEGTAAAATGTQAAAATSVPGDDGGRDTLTLVLSIAALAAALLTLGLLLLRRRAV